MSENRIERETVIAAPLERVFTLVADPGRFWAAEGTNPSGAVARAGESMMVTNPENDENALRVENVEPPTYVAYRWVSAFPGEELRENNSTLVEFTLAPEGDQTRLRVVESGFAALATSEDNRGNIVNDHTHGWPHVLDAFKTHAEK